MRVGAFDRVTKENDEAGLGVEEFDEFGCGVGQQVAVYGVTCVKQNVYENTRELIEGYEVKLTILI